MLKIVISTFLVVFFAELGDKTQFAVLSFTTKSQSPIAVLIGAGSALLLSTALAVGAGWLLLRTVPESGFRIVHYIVGVLFIGFGVWTVVKA